MESIDIFINQDFVVCNNCLSWFSSKRRPTNLQEIIFKKYIYKRQILKDLAQEYKRSLPWIRKQIIEYNTPLKVHNPKNLYYQT